MCENTPKRARRTIPVPTLTPARNYVAPAEPAGPREPLSDDDRYALDALAHSGGFCIATVQTRNSIYVVVRRNHRTTVICPDGRALTGPLLRFGANGGLLLCREDGHPLVHTTRIKACHIDAN